jgi:hypothetical protein
MPSEPESPHEEGGPQLYDFETDPGLVEEEGAGPATAPPPAEESDDFEALGPVDEAEKTGDDLYSDEEEEYRTEVRPADPDDEEEDDLLSESPEFLEQDTDEGLWFEKGPPKDFDFEDKDKDEE